MKLKNFLIIAFTICAFLVQSSCTLGIKKKSEPKKYDYLIFSQFINNNRIDNSGTLTAHGLWPQCYNNSRTCRALYCGGISQCDFCLSYNSESDSDFKKSVDALYNIKNTELARHEWIKHGTCSGMSIEDYFKEIERYQDKLSTPDIIKGNVGKSVSYDDIVKAYGGCDDHVQLRCAIDDVNNGNRNRKKYGCIHEQCLIGVNTAWTNSGDLLCLDPSEKEHWDSGTARFGVKFCKKDVPIHITDKSKARQ